MHLAAVPHVGPTAGDDDLVGGLLAAAAVTLQLPGECGPRCREPERVHLPLSRESADAQRSGGSRGRHDERSGDRRAGEYA